MLQKRLGTTRNVMIQPYKLGVEAIVGGRGAVEIVKTYGMIAGFWAGGN